MIRLGREFVEIISRRWLDRRLDRYWNWRPRWQ